MKVTITHYNKTYSVEQADDTDLNDTLETFKGLLLCMGFHPKSVDQAISCETVWFPEEDENYNSHPFLQNNVDDDELVH